MRSAIPAHVHIVAIGVLSVVTSFAQITPDQIAKAKALAVYAPRPAYPYEARSAHMTGRGVVVLNVDPSTGNVTSAELLQSTGHKILDDSALDAFRRWRFKPSSVHKVKIPINFTMQRYSPWLQNVDVTHAFLPIYPPDARAQALTGKGVAVVKVDPATGLVTSASMVKSTGHKILDAATLRAFRQWRFKPRSITTLEIPIQFTPKGVFY